MRYLSATVYRFSNWTARYAAFPLSTYALTLAPANAVSLLQPNVAQAGAGAITVQAPVHANASETKGSMFVTWQAPALTYDYSYNVSAIRGLISYTVYLAKG